MIVGGRRCIKSFSTQKAGRGIIIMMIMMIMIIMMMIIIRRGLLWGTPQITPAYAKEHHNYHEAPTPHRYALTCHRNMYSIQLQGSSSTTNR
jgi:hypothetical protein